MKLRYYLRGLGIGMLVSAAFFLSMGQKGTTLNDAQIREKAKQLGMIENPVLTDLVSSVAAEEETSGAEETELETLAPETESMQEEASVEETRTPSQETEEVQTAESQTQAQETGAEGATVVITVNSGDGSGTVSQRVCEAGLVTDAKEFDQYLMKNGYDKKITPGNHEIPADAALDEIARLLCKSARN